MRTFRHSPKETAPESAPVAVLVLAAGASTRMGRPKQMLPFAGEPLLRRVVEQALAASAARVFVVLGAYAAAVTPALAGLPVETIWNPDWEEGQGASVRVGVRYLLDRAPETGARLIKSDHSHHGYVTLTIDGDKISGNMTTVGPTPADTNPDADRFEYPAAAQFLPDSVVVSL